MRLKRLLWLLPFLTLSAQAEWHINDGQTSVIRNIVLYNDADPDAVITTVTSEDAGLTVLFCSNVATTCTTYDAATEFQPIATFGTYAAPAANNLSIEHITGGVYQVQVPDAVFASGSQMVMLISGAGVYPMAVEIFMDGINDAGITTAARAAIDAEDVARETTLNTLDGVADNIQLDTNDIQTTLAAGVPLEDGAITATKFGASAIDAAALATDAVTEITGATWAVNVDDGNGDDSLTAKCALALTSAFSAGPWINSGIGNLTTSNSDVSGDEVRMVHTRDDEGNFVTLDGITCP